MQDAPDCYGFGAKRQSTSFNVKITKVTADVILYKRIEGRKVRDCALPSVCVFGDWSREYAEGFDERHRVAFEKLGAELVKL
jgi:hypothetical protein